MHTQFRVLDRNGRQRDVVVRMDNRGWRSVRLGRTVPKISTILAWHGRKARLAALIAAVEEVEQ